MEVNTCRGTFAIYWFFTCLLRSECYQKLSPPLSNNLNINILYIGVPSVCIQHFWLVQWVCFHISKRKGPNSRHNNENKYWKRNHQKSKDILKACCAEKKHDSVTQIKLPWSKWGSERQYYNNLKPKTFSWQSKTLLTITITIVLNIPKAAEVAIQRTYVHAHKKTTQAHTKTMFPCSYMWMCCIWYCTCFDIGVHLFV